MLVDYEGGGAFKASADYIDLLVVERELTLKFNSKGIVLDLPDLTETINSQLKEIGFEDVNEVRNRLAFMIEQIVRARRSAKAVISDLVLTEATRQADEDGPFHP